MERVPKSTQVRFKMPHLYRNDLQAIENILKHELHAKTFKVRIKNLEYNSVDEISKGHDPMNELLVETRDPYLSINLNGYSATLYCENDDIASVGAILKIREIISRGERPWRFFNTQGWWPSFIVGVFSGLLVARAFFAAINGQKILSFVYLIPPFSLLIWDILYHGWSLKTFSTVEFIDRKEVSFFWIRKKDDILVAVISVVLGAILGIIGTLILHT